MILREFLGKNKKKNNKTNFFFREELFECDYIKGNIEKYKKGL